MSNKDRTPRHRPPKEGSEREWTRLGQLAFEFLGYLLVLGYAGWWLDQKQGWNGRALFGGLMLGLAAWLYRVLRVTRDMFK